MIHKYLFSLPHLTVLTPFRFLKIIYFGFSHLPLTEVTITILLPVSTRPVTFAKYSASTSPPTVLGAQSSVCTSLYFSIYILPRELIFSQLVTESCINTMLMNFNSVTSRSRLYSRLFKTSSLTRPALNSEFNASSLKNRFPCELLNFH